MTRDDIMTSRRAAGGVKRYHAYPTLQTQTVADHSWRVAMIYQELFPGDVNSSVLIYILEHDLAELHTGDVPFHVKNKYPVLRDALHTPEVDGLLALGLKNPKLDKDSRSLVKLCDILEMFEFGLVERALGSRFAQPIIDGTRWKASGLAEELELTETVRKWCDREEARYA